MAFYYASGEQINPGDRVRLGDVEGHIELVADPATDPNDWYVTAHGGGVMFADPKVYGRLFIKWPPHAEADECDKPVFLCRRVQTAG
jgi:hypothetical protein